MWHAYSTRQVHLAQSGVRDSVMDRSHLTGQLAAKREHRRQFGDAKQGPGGGEEAE